MRVYLVQHGESKSEEEDPQRRLTDKGIGEVQIVADFLRPLKLAVDAIWHSDKARAADRGTARGGGLGAGSSRTARRPWPEGPGRRNERSARTNRRRLDDRWPPPVSRQTRRLVRHRQRKNEIVEFRFGGVVCVERRDNKKWKVAWMVTPSLLHG